MNKIIAHRGFSSRKLENTLEAFELAFNKDYIDIVEVDIRMTKDNKIICIHDGYIRNKFNLRNNIKDINYSDLKKPISNKFKHLLNAFKNIKNIRNFITLIKYINKKGKIPLLEDVLNIMPLNKEILIDIKVDKDQINLKSYQNEIIKVVDKFKNKKISIMSFNEEILNNIKNKRKNIKIGILIKKKINNIYKSFDFYSIKSNYLSQKTLNYLIEEKKEIYVWTINTYSDYLLLKKNIKENLNKIAITTDFPDLILFLLKNKGEIK